MCICIYRTTSFELVYIYILKFRVCHKGSFVQPYASERLPSLFWVFPVFDSSSFSISPIHFSDSLNSLNSDSLRVSIFETWDSEFCNFIASLSSLVLFVWTLVLVVAGGSPLSVQNPSSAVSIVGGLGSTASRRRNRWWKPLARTLIWRLDCLKPSFSEGKIEKTSNF